MVPPHRGRKAFPATNFMLDLAEVPVEPNNLAAVAKPCHVEGDNLEIVESLEPAGGDLWYESLTRLSTASVMGGAEVTPGEITCGMGAPAIASLAILPLQATA